MKIHSLIFIAALGATSVVAQDATKPATPAVAAAPVSVTDPQQFAEMAASSNAFEIESSKLALEKAMAPQTKDFAQHMIDDHTKAGEEMQTAAEAQGGVSLPTTMDQKHQGLLDELNATTADFDAQYLSLQLTAHREAVALFEAYSTNGAAGPLKDFATKTLPTLQEHLDRVSSQETPSDQASAAASPSADQSILATGYVPTDMDNLSTEIVGKQVYSSTASDAEHIGDVNNLVIGEDGQVAAVIIGVGGFLGIGEKNVAVKYAELAWVTAEDGSERFVLPTSKEALEGAPAFESSDARAPAAPSAPAPSEGAAAPATN
jgi:putative membrane protein